MVGATDRKEYIYMDKKKETKPQEDRSQKAMTIVGIVICVILVPILVINCILLIKGWTNGDEVPSIGNISPMIVLTPSMEGDGEDNFSAGDLIFIKLIEPDEVEVGDVISFYDPDGSGTSVLTHRVVEIFEKDGKTYFTTKGDANNANDPTPAPAENLIGEYTEFRIAGAGNVAMFMQTTWGLVICVFLPMVLLVGYDALRRARYAKAHDADKDALMAELEELRRLKAEKTATEGEKTPESAEDTPESGET